MTGATVSKCHWNRQTHKAIKLVRSEESDDDADMFPRCIAAGCSSIKIRKIKLIMASSERRIDHQRRQYTFPPFSLCCLRGSILRGVGRRRNWVYWRLSFLPLFIDRTHKCVWFRFTRRRRSASFWIVEFLSILLKNCLLSLSSRPPA